MLVSHRKSFVFTKTVKTAGTSVESYFERWCMPEGEWQQLHGRPEHISAAGIVGERSSHPSNARWYNHMSAYNIRKQLGHDCWERYLKFTVVRNPYDKLISGFFMFGRNPSDDRSGYDEIRGFRTWLHSFGKFVAMNKMLIEAQEAPHYSKPIVLSLIDRDKYLIDGNECVDQFIRHENLVTDMENLCDKLMIPFEVHRIPEFKKSKRDHQIPISEYFDRQSQEIVQELYAWEISRFGYSLPE